MVVLGGGGLMGEVPLYTGQFSQKVFTTLSAEIEQRSHGPAATQRTCLVLSSDDVSRGRLVLASLAYGLTLMRQDGGDIACMYSNKEAVPVLIKVSLS